MKQTVILSATLLFLVGCYSTSRQAEQGGPPAASSEGPTASAAVSVGESGVSVQAAADGTDSQETDSIAAREVGNINRASKLLGMTVRNEQKETLGQVQDLLVDMQTGRVPFAIVSAGGFLGVGDRLVVVPPMALEIGEGRNELMLQADKEKLKGSQHLTAQNWSEVSNPAWGAQVYKYYGQRPYWDNSARGGMLQAPARNDEDRLQNLRRASDMLGLNVRNSKNQTLGDIKDLVIDLDSGRIAYVVMSAGGFLGVGGKLIAVPSMAFANAGEEGQLVLNVDRDQIRRAPGFDSNNWPDMNTSAWGAEIFDLPEQSPSRNQNQQRNNIRD